MKDALTTNTLEADGYGKGKFAPSRPEGFVKERNKAQTERITCQPAGLSTIFVPASKKNSGSFMGKGLAVKRNTEFRLQVDVPHLQAQHEAKL